MMDAAQDNNDRKGSRVPSLSFPAYLVLPFGGVLVVIDGMVAEFHIALAAPLFLEYLSRWPLVSKMPDEYR